MPHINHLEPSGPLSGLPIGRIIANPPARVTYQTLQDSRRIACRCRELYISYTSWEKRMTGRYSIAEAREHLADLVNRAAYAGERPVLTRRGRPIAAIVPIADLHRLERSVDAAPLRLALSSACLAELENICRRHRVRELSLFGSALRDDFDADSDVDLLVEFEPDAQIGFIELGRLEADLIRCFGRPIDLVSKRGLRPILREEVLSTSRVIYAS